MAGFRCIYLILQYCNLARLQNGCLTMINVVTEQMMYINVTLVVRWPLSKFTTPEEQQISPDHSLIFRPPGVVNSKKLHLTLCMRECKVPQSLHSMLYIWCCKRIPPFGTIELVFGQSLSWLSLLVLYKKERLISNSFKPATTWDSLVIAVANQGN